MNDVKTHCYTLMRGDCLERMKEIPDSSVDMVLTDPPYGTTACSWDSVIPFEPMWAQLKRITKKNGAVVLFGGEPFSSHMRVSNIKMYKYDWVWDKVTARGHLVAKKRPMAQNESISVFYSNAPTYNPQMTLKSKPQKGSSVESSRTELIGGATTKQKLQVIRTHSYPKTILTFGMDKNCGHPTQKPVALMEYLTKTYTNPNETVLDFTMGSGTTGVAAMNLGRKFIGIELDDKYFAIAEERIKQAFDAGPWSMY